MNTCRCKFKFTEKHTYDGGDSCKLIFYPQYDESIPEDQRFNKYTPSGKFEMLVSGPALDFFKLGKYYYFDAVEVPTEVK